MPIYVSAPLPAGPIASEYSVPPTATSHPRALHPSRTALIDRSGTLLSTKMAFTRRSTIKLTKRDTSLTPYSATVEMP